MLQPQRSPTATASLFLAARFYIQINHEAVAVSPDFAMPSSAASPTPSLASPVLHEPALTGSDMAPKWSEQEPLVPRCRMCAKPVEVLAKGVRFYSKSKVYQCSVCCVRHVGICTAFGSSKFPELSALTKEEQESFWDSLPTSNDGIQRAVTNLIIKVRLDTHKDSISGEFLPLGVWASKGFDATKIETESLEQDIEIHPLLGTTYRVKIHQTMDAREERRVRQETLEEISKRNPKAKALKVDEERSQEAGEQGKVEASGREKNLSKKEKKKRNWRRGRLSKKGQAEE
jgi:hypothetical protein